MVRRQLGLPPPRPKSPGHARGNPEPHPEAPSRATSLAKSRNIRPHHNGFIALVPNARKSYNNNVAICVYGARRTLLGGNAVESRALSCIPKAKHEGDSPGASFKCAHKPKLRNTLI